MDEQLVNYLNYDEEWLDTESKKFGNKHRKRKPSDSAVTSFKALLEGIETVRHFNDAKSILKKLLSGRPLNPIDIKDRSEWNEYKVKEKTVLNVSKHYPSLSVEVTQIDDSHRRMRVYDKRYSKCIDIMHPDRSIQYEFINTLVHEYFPITFPYLPDTPYLVYYTSYSDPRQIKNIDIYIKILFIITPESKRKTVCKYAKLSKDGSIIDIYQSGLLVPAVARAHLDHICNKSDD